MMRPATAHDYQVEYERAGQRKFDWRCNCCKEHRRAPEWTFCCSASPMVCDYCGRLSGPGARKCEHCNEENEMSKKKSTSVPVPVGGKGKKKC